MHLQTSVDHCRGSAVRGRPARHPFPIRLNQHLTNGRPPMASHEELVAYHRSFLSPFYTDVLRAPNEYEKLLRKAAEVEAIRLRDPEAFEEARKDLAKALKVPYSPGWWARPSGDVGRNDRWVEGSPPDAKVAEVMDPTNPRQGAVRSPMAGMVALPNLERPMRAYVHGKDLHEVTM